MKFAGIGYDNVVTAFAEYRDMLGVKLGRCQILANVSSGNCTAIVANGRFSVRAIRIRRRTIVNRFMAPVAPS